MQKRSASVLVMVLVFVLGPMAWAGPPAKPGESWVPYEMAPYDPPEGDQRPGVHLNAPGDLYRYTFLIDDKYSKDPSYTISRAILGIHTLDPDYTKESGDGAKEWGKILINGKPRALTSRSYAAKGEKEGAVNAFMEIDSDPEAEGSPPYIYNITDQLNDGKLVIEVINVREDGSIEGDAPFGDFMVLRAGLHLFWKKR